MLFGDLVVSSALVVMMTTMTMATMTTMTMTTTTLTSMTMVAISGEGGHVLHRRRRDGRADWLPQAPLVPGPQFAPSQFAPPASACVVDCHKQSHLSARAAHEQRDLNAPVQSPGCRASAQLLLFVPFVPSVLFFLFFFLHFVYFLFIFLFIFLLANCLCSHPNTNLLSR